jgi:hypothetical protein
MTRHLFEICVKTGYIYQLDKAALMDTASVA